VFVARSGPITGRAALARDGRNASVIDPDSDFQRSLDQQSRASRPGVVQAAGSMIALAAGVGS